MTWALWFGLGGLAFSLLLYFYVKSQPAGDEGMRELAGAIQTGAMAFLRREYSVLVPFVLVVAVMLFWLIGPSSAAAYVFGAACSILAGFLGMQAATRANVRTTEAARDSGLAKALRVAGRQLAVPGVVDAMTMSTTRARISSMHLRRVRDEEPPPAMDLGEYLRALKEVLGRHPELAFGAAIVLALMVWIALR